VADTTRQRKPLGGYLIARSYPVKKSDINLYYFVKITAPPEITYSEVFDTDEEAADCCDKLAIERQTGIGCMKVIGISPLANEKRAPANPRLPLDVSGSPAQQALFAAEAEGAEDGATRRR